MTDYTVFGGNKLPDSFDETKNSYYYKQYRVGDKIARDMLIKHNLRLVFSIIKQRKYDKLGYDMEDLMSIGIEGLIKGIDSYNEGMNDKMSAYISQCIRIEILNFLRKENYYKQKGYYFVSVDDIAKEKDGDFISNGDVLRIGYSSVEEIVIEKLMDRYYRDMMDMMLGWLSDRDRKVFRLSYGLVDGKIYKQEEIARIVALVEVVFR